MEFAQFCKHRLLILYLALTLVSEVLLFPKAMPDIRANTIAKTLVMFRDVCSYEIFNVC